MLQQDPLISTDQDVPNGCRGSIVNTASIAGLGVLGGLSAYHASKHSVVSMTRVDARQFADNGIRVNCVCPGFVDTPMFRGSGLSDEYIEAAKSQAPMHRFVAASEVADGVLFLSGSSASAITGVSLPIDAGALLFHIV
jgi:NAD(P)-dependent dehydrogenase (short-subunit alcohol dehydrogenase family)